MPRFARLVVPGIAHHVTQRGNRKQRTFFGPGDYRTYLSLLARFSEAYGVQVLCYCLMPNHVHLLLAPRTSAALARGVGRTHEAYSRIINARMGWRGYLWQGRFNSFPMSDAHLIAATRYVLLNPVRAGLVRSPEAWRWSSAAAHLAGESDGVADIASLAPSIADWSAFLRLPVAESESEQFRRHSRTGRPLGNDAFVSDLEAQTGRVLRPRKPGPPARRSGDTRLDPIP